MTFGKYLRWRVGTRPGPAILYYCSVCIAIKTTVWRSTLDPLVQVLVFIYFFFHARRLFAFTNHREFSGLNPFRRYIIPFIWNTIIVSLSTRRGYALVAAAFTVGKSKTTTISFLRHPKQTVSTKILLSKTRWFCLNVSTRLRLANFYSAGRYDTIVHIAHRGRKLELFYDYKHRVEIRIKYRGVNVRLGQKAQNHIHRYAFFCENFGFFFFEWEDWTHKPEFKNNYLEES